MYWPSLDGLRGFAVVLVMAYHLGYRAPLGGFLGVDVFFVLSGFLITTLLLNEISQRAAIAFRCFYARRGLRLLPALAAVCIVASVAVALRGSPTQQQHTFVGVPLALFYVVNWAMALGHVTDVGWLSHTWSLAIEEQFYLVGPALLLLLLRSRAARRHAVGLLVGAAVVVIAYRFAMAARGWPPHRLYMGLDTHCDGLLVGAALAFWLSRGGSDRGDRFRFRVALVAVIALGITSLFGSFDDRFGVAVAVTVTTFATAAVMAHLLASRRPTVLHSVLQARACVWTGRRSYGLYLWHYPAYQLVNTVNLPFPLSPAVKVALSFLVAAASYRYVEAPFLALKSRFRPPLAVTPVGHPDAERPAEQRP